MDYSEKWGKSVDEAVELALADLKLSRDEVTVLVLEEPSKGFLGLGSKLARVRVEPVSKEEKSQAAPAEEPAVTIEEAVEPSPNKETEDVIAPPPGCRNESSDRREKKNRSHGPSKAAKSSGRVATSERQVFISRKPDDLKPVEDSEALDFLKKVTEEMGLSLTFKGEMNEDSLYIDIRGKGVGSIIGKRGQTLDSLQYLTSLVVNRDRDKYVRVVLDAENYRAKREKTLEQLAGRLADKVVRSGRSVKLEPMNPYERMIIHATLQNDDRIKTRSEGDEPHRKVIIELDK